MFDGQYGDISMEGKHRKNAEIDERRQHKNNDYNQVSFTLNILLRNPIWTLSVQRCSPVDAKSLVEIDCQVEVQLNYKYIFNYELYLKGYVP